MISKLEIADILIASANHSIFNYENIFRISSVQSLSRIRLQPHGLQHARLPCLSPTPRACSNSC